jgi:hypothetical protein
VSPKQLQPWAQVNHILGFKITHQVDINFPVGVLCVQVTMVFYESLKKKAPSPTLLAVVLLYTIVLYVLKGSKESEIWVALDICLLSSDTVY